MRENWLAGHLEEVPSQGQRTCLVEGLSGPVLACDAMTRRYINKARQRQKGGERKDIPRPGGGAMPGAPPTPGKPLKEGGGPYGFPPVVGSGQLLVATAKGSGRKGLDARSPPYGL